MIQLLLPFPDLRGHHHAMAVRECGACKALGRWVYSDCGQCRKEERRAHKRKYWTATGRDRNGELK